MSLGCYLWELPHQMICFHLTISSTSSFFFLQYIHLPPLWSSSWPLCSYNFSILLPSLSLSILSLCPNHPNRLPCVYLHCPSFVQLFQPAWTCLFTSFLHRPLLWTVEPKDLMSSNFFASSLWQSCSSGVPLVYINSNEFNCASPILMMAFD